MRAFFDDIEKLTPKDIDFFSRKHSAGNILNDWTMTEGSKIFKYLFL
jgi:hypothetical protein